MRCHLAFLLLLAAVLDVFCAPVSIPSVMDLNTPREFPTITTQAEWQQRARLIREQILVSSGLWPMPDKTPLHAQIFGKVAHDGYSVEKVYFQTYPGFYLAGNLYRPLGRDDGPFAAILSPHGHWENGRLADNQDCSIPGRCINFAKQGMIAFSYDMVGYNDTHFSDSPTNQPFYKVHRDFATNDPAAQLWSISLMGLQTWNSIRALDFLASLPDADPHRLAITGESGGGTQTFMLGAIDDRLAAQAPVVMVSHTMQGGCGCENMPGLRVEFSNMEIAAAAAPRPQIMVGASGDWTKTMLTVEGPNVAHIYDLFHAPENLRYVRFDFPHNYNQTSREAVYQWFGKQLLSQPDALVKEAAFQKEPDEELRVFRDGKLPPDALSQADLIKYLIKTRAARLRELEPKDEMGLANYKKIMEPAWQRTLQLDSPKDSAQMFALSAIIKSNQFTAFQLGMSRSNENKQSMLALYCTEKTNSASQPSRVVLLLPDDSKVYADPPTAKSSPPIPNSNPPSLVKKLLDHGLDVVLVRYPTRMQPQDESSIFFTTYNRTRLQEQVRDLILICDSAKSINTITSRKVVLCGTGQSAFWSLLAAPAADAVIADCSQLDVSKDQNLLLPGLFCPGLRNIGTFIGAPILAAPHPLLLHNVADNFPTAPLRSTYKALNATNKFQSESRRLTDDQIVAWISQQK